jgi:hypothetical protein
MQSKLDKLRVGAMLPETIHEDSGTITIKDETVLIVTRKPGSTRILQKVIPLHSVISIEVDRENKGKIVYRTSGGEIIYKAEYKPAKSTIPGFVSMTKIIDEKASNKVLPTTLHVRATLFMSIHESSDTSKRKEKDSGKKPGKKKNK